MEFVVRFVLNKFFILGVLIFGVVFFVLDVGHVQSSLFGVYTAQKNVDLGSNLQARNSVDSTVVKQTQMHLLLGGDDVRMVGTYADAMKVLQSLDLYIRTDVVELLSSSRSRQQVLAAYNANVQKTLDDALSVRGFFDIELAKYQSENSSCESAKTQADAWFVSALSTYDPSGLEISLRDSVEQWECAMKSRILWNSYRILASRIEFLRQILEEKNALILANEDNILQHFDLFKDQLLEALVDLRDKLNSYSQS